MRFFQKEFLLSCVLFFLIGTTWGQEEIKIQLNWGKHPDTMVTPSNRYLYPHLDGSFITFSQFIYLQKFDRSSFSSNWELKLINYTASKTGAIAKEFLNNFSIPIPSTPTFTIKNIGQTGNPKAVLSVVPFISINGQLQKITSLTFQKKIISNNFNKSPKFALSSVLQKGSGEWYKIRVEEDGVYKIDYDFLKSIGVEVKNINPKSINLYGNSFGRLPELNSEYRPDDLLKNDILVRGGADGSFDKEDYILFYGKGPDKWEKKGKVFHRNLNIYARYTAYFININPANPPARMHNAALSSQPVTDVVTDYNSYTIHEKEEVNIKHSGQRWYGELFDANLTQNFTMNIPYLNTSAPASIRGYMACKNSRKPSIYFKVGYKGNQLANIEMQTSNNNSYTRNGFLTSPGVFNPTSSTFSIRVEFNRLTPNDVGYLDFLEVNARSHLTYFEGIEFRDIQSVGIGNVAEMRIGGFPSSGVVWEITNPTQPKIVQGNYSNGTYTYKIAADNLRSFIAFEGNYKAPKFIERVKHQNLHGLGQAEYLIVTHPRFVSQAQRLANLHRANGMIVHVVTTEKIYNEFSGGTQDPTAIKDFARMFYKRAIYKGEDPPKYLLLFGDGTYDPLNRVANNNYMVPVYETLNSETYTSTLVSDDYFGLLDDKESFSPLDLLDIAVGRLIATTKQDATNLVNKIETYMKNGSNLYASSDLTCCEGDYVSTQGNWRLRYTLIGDDEENGYFIEKDLEPAAKSIDSIYPMMNGSKIYSDAYQQVTTAGGQRYPEVEEEILRSITAGSILTYYDGHGGPTGAAAERIITMGGIKSLKNIDKLTLFVSATCDFSRIDDNERVSAGELMVLNKLGGAIAMMTTTRGVFFTTNTAMTALFFANVFKRNNNKEPLTFGDIILKTKNGIVGGNNNRRCFLLLGDPALKIALPYKKAVLDSINNVNIHVKKDTIKALSKVRMIGHIEDQYGNHLSNFNGIIIPSIFDKPSSRKTLGQDQDSPVIEFLTQESVLFNGKVSVKKGVFDFEFIVPRDIDYSYGKGKTSFYGWTEGGMTAGGYSNNFYIGGIDTTGLDDHKGPTVELYLNDDNFVNGGITDATPILIAKFHDKSGVNTVGNGIGHNISMIIDEESSEAVKLNDFYKADLDTYKSGELRYQLSKLKEGRHSLTIKVWDVNNNSSEAKLEFQVYKATDIALDHVLNYPNPFTTHTEFMFEHNQAAASLQVQIQIYTITGRLVKTINKAIQTRGFREAGIPWNGRDQYGDQLARGVYIYRLTVRNSEGQEARKMQKLYLLR